MSKNKNNQAIWGNRIKKNTSSIFQKVGNSIDVDKRLYKEIQLYPLYIVSYQHQ